MRAIECRALGPPSVPLGEGGLHLSEKPAPTLAGKRAPHAVRIKVIAAGLNFADVLVVQGKYQEKPPLPFVAGAEVSGVVLEVGEKVKGLAPGDCVAAFLPQMGGFADEVVADSASVIKLGQGTDVAAAAGLPIAYGTSHVALLHRCRLRAGQTVLVLGAAGGVGLAAVQIAKAVGARVVAVARGAQKLAALRAAGADVCVDSSALGKGGLKAALEGEGVKGGVDVVYDPVGGKLSADSLRVVKWGGQVAVIGFASGEIPTIPANLLLVKNVTVHGIYWGSYLLHSPAVLHVSLRELADWLAQGKIKINVSHTFPLEQANRAFGALLNRDAIGKVLLVTGAQAKL